MSQINTGGVIKGGLAAGILMAISESILNVPVTGARAERELAALNLPFPTMNAIAVFLVTTVIVGILMVYLYAALRPRFGPGPATAIKTGVLVWLLTYAYSAVFFVGVGVNSMTLAVIGVVWTFFECVIAALVGGYLYSES